MLLLLLISTFMLSASAKPNPFKLQMNPRCIEYCSYVPPQDNLYISGNVLKPILEMSFENICESLTDRNCHNLEEHRRITNIDPDRKVLKTSMSEICEIINDSEPILADTDTYLQDEMTKILSKIRDKTVEEICDNYSYEYDCDERKSRAKNHYSTFCTSVCASVFDEDLENKVIKGAYLKNLRADSLRKNCRYLLSSRAVSKLDDAYQLVFSTRYLEKWLQMETEMAKKKMEYAVAKVDELKKSKQTKMSALKSALNDLEAVESEDGRREARSKVYTSEKDVFRENALLDRMESVKNQAYKKLLKFEMDLHDAKDEADKALREKERLDDDTRKILLSIENLDY